MFNECFQAMFNKLNFSPGLDAKTGSVGFSAHPGQAKANFAKFCCCIVRLSPQMSTVVIATPVGGPQSSQPTLKWTRVRLDNFNRPRLGLSLMNGGSKHCEVSATSLSFGLPSTFANQSIKVLWNETHGMICCYQFTIVPCCSGWSCQFPKSEASLTRKRGI